MARTKKQGLSDAFIIIGEYPVLCNGKKTHVIIEFRAKTREEAEKIAEDRQSRYKNIRILEV